jgi:hypothetical protein
VTLRAFHGSTTPSVVGQRIMPLGRECQFGLNMLKPTRRKNIES